jgi:hypothetical protein
MPLYDGRIVALVGDQDDRADTDEQAEQLGKMSAHRAALRGVTL